MAAIHSSCKLVLDQLREPVASDLTILDEVICEQLSSDVPLIRQITQYIVQSGGKRIRPLLLLTMAKACGYEGQEQVMLAAVIEFIHTATLLHDDVVDDSSMRRGVSTAHQLFGGQASILVGDFLYSRAFQLMASHSNVSAMQFLARVTNQMSEGEVMQLMTSIDVQQSYAHYYQIIEAKTASLFSAATYMAGLLACQQKKAPIVEANAFIACGHEFGMAYQIIDDVLDYSGDSAKLGKQLGDDLAEGKVTLPLIYAIEQSAADTADTIRTIIAEKERVHLNVVIDAMEKVGALDYCRQRAADHMQKARMVIDALPESDYKQALYGLMTFVLERDM